MLLNIQFLDDATRPPVPKLEGLTDAQRAPGLHLREVHDHLRQNMTTLGKLIERASAGAVTPEEIAAETGDLAMSPTTAASATSAGSTARSSTRITQSRIITCFRRSPCRGQASRPLPIA